MSNALKGALWSALASPGAGQIALKRYRRGIVLLSVFSVSLLVYVMEAVRQASALVDKIITEGAAIDVNEIEKSAGSGSPLSSLLGWLIIVCWIVGIVDAYRIGREKDIQDRLASQSSSESTPSP